MTDETMSLAPRTKAGRALLKREALNSRAFPIITATMVRAVEDEAAGVRVAPSPTEGDALDNAYRERNAVVAALIRTNGWKASLTPAPDADGWWIVYAETPQGQVSWHVAPVDIRLFDGIPVEYAKWDGHTTDEKYERVARLGVAPSPTEGECGFNEPHEAHEYVVAQDDKPVDLACPGVAPSPDAPGRGWREASRDLIAAGDDEDEPSDGTVDRYRLIQEVRKAARGIDHSLADEPDYERFDAAIVALEHAAAARALEVVRLARPKCDLVCGHTRDHWIAEENDDA